MTDLELLLQQNPRMRDYILSFLPKDQITPEVLFPLISSPHFQQYFGQASSFAASNSQQPANAMEYQQNQVDVSSLSLQDHVSDSEAVEVDEELGEDEKDMLEAELDQFLTSGDANHSQDQI